MGPPLHQAPASLRSTHLALVDRLVQVGMKHLVAAFCWRGHGADSVAPGGRAPGWDAGLVVARRETGESLATMTNEPNEERLRITDAAAFLGVSRQRVQQLLHADRLPEPDAVDKRGPIWDQGTIETWAREQWCHRDLARGREREPGRTSAASRTGRAGATQPSVPARLTAGSNRRRPDRRHGSDAAPSQRGMRTGARGADVGGTAADGDPRACCRRCSVGTASSDPYRSRDRSS